MRILPQFLWAAFMLLSMWSYGQPPQPTIAQPCDAPPPCDFVCNGSFESGTNNTSFNTRITFGEVPYWMNGHLLSPNANGYYESPDFWLSPAEVPNNPFNHPLVPAPAHTGANYVGFAPYLDHPDYAEYIQQEFDQPLPAGNYEFSMWVLRASQRGLLNTGPVGQDNVGDIVMAELGAIVSANPPNFISPGSGSVLDGYNVNNGTQSYLTLTSGNGWLNDRLNWVELKVNFTANGNETFLTIGRFKDPLVNGTDFLNTVHPNETTQVGSYYFVDDISITRDFGSLNLPGPIAACENDPDIQLNATLIGPNSAGYTYNWTFNGGPIPFLSNPNSTSLTIPTDAAYSGTYCFTIYDPVTNCFDEECVDVTIDPNTVITLPSITVCDRNVPILLGGANGNPSIITNSPYFPVGGSLDPANPSMTVNFPADYYFDPAIGIGTYTMVYYLPNSNGGCDDRYEMDIVVEDTYWPQTSSFSQGGTGDKGNDVAVDNAGNVFMTGSYITGTRFSSNTMTQLTNMPNHKGMYLVKYDPCGDLEWVVSTFAAVSGSSAESFAVTTKGREVYITGTCTRNTTFTSTDVIGNQTVNPGGEVMFVAHYSNAGVLVNLQLVPNAATAFRLIPASISVNPGGGLTSIEDRVYVGGHYPAGNRAWVMGLDEVSAGGGFTLAPWAPLLATNNNGSHTHGVKADANDYVLFTGSFSAPSGASAGSLTFMDYPTTSIFSPTVTSVTTQDAFVYRFKDLGNTVDWSAGANAWGISMGSPSGTTAVGYDIDVNFNGLPFVVGEFTGSVTAPFGIPYVSGVSVNKRGFVTRLNKNTGTGGTNWFTMTTNTTGDVDATGIAVKGKKEVYITGSFSGINPLLIVPGQPSIPFTGTRDNVYTSRLDGANGLAYWVNTTNDISTNGSHYASKVAVSPVDPYCFSVGDYSNSMDFLNNPFGLGLNSTGTGRNAYALRHHSDISGGEIRSQMLETYEAPSETTAGEITLKAYPNPVHTTLRVEVTSSTSTTLELIDVTGAVVLSKQVNDPVVTFDLSSLAAGVYNLVARSERGIEVLRVVKD